MTAEDRLWLARAVEAEGEPRDLVAQTLINRWAAARDRGDGATLTDAIRSYAQPVNPRWFPAGDLHVAAYQAAAPAERARLQARAVRRQNEHAQAVTFSPATLRAVAIALRGPLTIPPGALHYAPETDARNAAFSLLVRGPNAIYGVRNDAHPTRYDVTRLVAASSPRSSGLLVPLGFLAAAVLAVQLFLKTKAVRS